MSLPASLFNPSNTLKIIITFLLISLPFIALANAGSPILWFNIFHLLFINAAIGYIESEILLKYKLANKVWTVILANYISMFVGFFVIMPNLIKGKYGGTMWDRNTVDLLYGLGISFIATLLIEYLFFVAALKDKKQKKILFKPFLIANLVTNVAMIFIYFLFMKASP